MRFRSPFPSHGIAAALLMSCAIVAPAAVERVAMDHGHVAALAEKRAHQPYQPSGKDVPKYFREIDYDTYRRITFRPDTTLSALAKCMITGRRRSVPVVDGRRVVGVVTRRDVVETMAHSDDAIRDGVHHRFELAGFPNRWLIRVQAGVVHLWGVPDSQHERDAVRIAESVPGVIRVTVSGPDHAGVIHQPDDADHG